MTFRILLRVFFLTTLLFTKTLSAQVTIGLDELPTSGSLLQLKNLAGVLDDPNATKGLGLPRVILSDLTNLYPMFNNDGTGNYKIGTTTYIKSDQDDKHIGLVVYNISQDELCGIPSGIYVWTGNNWERMPEKPSLHSDAIYQPNSYMLASGVANSVAIPVEKAFAIWEFFGTDEVNRLPKETISGPLSAKVFWQDGNVIVGSPFILGSDRNATININTTGNVGNAVVALYDNGGTIRWSWHIWVTPTMGTKSFAGYTWMDRDLGATSNVVGADGTIGLQYQWGRKDPLPGYAKYDGTLRTLTGEQSSVDIISSTTLATENLKNSITNPLSFIKAYNSPSGGGWLEEDFTGWSNRWEEDDCGRNIKTVIDPCPSGWILAPWMAKDDMGISSTFRCTFELLQNIMPFAKLQTNRGWLWTPASSNGFDVGFWPFSGMRNASGALVGIGTIGDFYNAQTIGSGYAHIQMNATNTWIGGRYDVEASSVRCVRQD